MQACGQYVVGQFLASYFYIFVNVRALITGSSLDNFYWFFKHFFLPFFVSSALRMSAFRYWHGNSLILFYVPSLSNSAWECIYEKKSLVKCGDTGDVELNLDELGPADATHE